ncbi:MAG: hypothetical protein WDN03_02250 [Rhizomicrobium sp.]
MQFFLIRRLVELILFRIAFEPFHGCANLHELWMRVWALPELTIIGVAACLLLALTGAYELVEAASRQLVRLILWLTTRFRPGFQKIGKHFSWFAARIQRRCASIFARVQKSLRPLLTRWFY